MRKIAALIVDTLKPVLPLLADARSRTLSYTTDLSDEQFNVPLLDTINPFLWELGHISYFAELWILRNVYGRQPILANADALFDSAKVPHDDRWSLLLPSRAEMIAFMEAELGEITRAAGRGDEATPKDASYFYQLALYHEDMHGEAFLYTRQTLGYPHPSRGLAEAPKEGGLLPDFASVPGGTYTIGGMADDGFVFDNEKWAHEISLQDFEIARAPVTNAEFAAFIADGGYRARGLWSPAGWTWREAMYADCPVYWRHAPGVGVLGWERRHFDSWKPVRPHEPVCHINWYEADAFCCWVGRRLPSEAEWEVACSGNSQCRYPWGNEGSPLEYANVDARIGDVVDVGAFASGDSPFGCRQMIGNVWEWTSSAFGPYPGFVRDPYKEYSEPWFGSHMVLRGGAWSTRARLITSTWRNFYRPERRDIITGFRTCRS